MIYAIGDIHGQHVMLKALLAKMMSMPLRKDDIVLFLGDYVDRGENSRAVIEMLIKWGQERPNTIFLRGNHEQLMLDVRKADPAERARCAVAWLRNGGAEALQSYNAPGVRAWYERVADLRTPLPPGSLEELAQAMARWTALVPDAHWEFLAATQMEHVADRFHFVHAGLLAPDQAWDQERLGFDPRLWIREPFLSSQSAYDGKLVIFGHTPQRNRKPLIQRHKICLDTGAVYGGPLVAGLFDNSPGAVAKLAGVLEVPFSRSLAALFKPIPVDTSRVRKRRSSAGSSMK